MKSEKYKNWFEVKAQISIETISEKNYVVAIRYDCNEPVDYRSGSTQLDQCLQYGTLLVVCKHFTPVIIIMINSQVTLFGMNPKITSPTKHTTQCVGCWQKNQEVRW